MAGNEERALHGRLTKQNGRGPAPGLDATSQRGGWVRTTAPAVLAALVLVLAASYTGASASRTRPDTPGGITGGANRAPVQKAASPRATEKDPPQGMVLIPGGTFDMGIDEGELDELVEMGQDVPHMSEGLARSWFGVEMPKHTVDVDAFYMDVHEVTNGQFGEFVTATGYAAEGRWQKHSREDRADHPVVNVTWNDAQAYAAWAGKRLPSEAEWEYAAKGGQDVRWFPWGDEPDPTRANYRHQGESFWEGIPRLLGLRPIDTKPGGSYPANGYGLYDLCGNVREWCDAAYEPYPGAPQDEDLYSRRPACGSCSCEQRRLDGKVVRGGSWESPNAVFVRITGRNGFEADHSAYDLGFRCVQSP